MLNFRRAGRGSAVVLQHGIFGGSGYWLFQMQHLSCRHDVIAPDLPGFAGSACVPSPETIEGFAAALVGVVDALQINRFALVGHSLGGMIAQQVALDFPDRLERLVLYGTSPIGNIPGRFESITDSIARLDRDGIEATTIRFAKTWFLEEDRAPTFGFCLEAGKWAEIESAKRTLHAIDRWDVTGRLGEIRVPTLVICGDGDRGTPPENSLRLYRAIPGARLAVLPGAAHNLHLERTGAFNRTVGDFLAGTF